MPYGGQRAAVAGGGGVSEHVTWAQVVSLSSKPLRGAPSPPVDALHCLPPSTCCSKGSWPALALARLGSIRSLSSSFFTQLAADDDDCYLINKTIRQKCTCSVRHRCRRHLLLWSRGRASALVGGAQEPLSGRANCAKSQTSFRATLFPLSGGPPLGHFASPVASHLSLESPALARMMMMMMMRSVPLVTINRASGVCQ